MFNEKLRKIISKKAFIYPFVMVFVLTVTFAFIPHYSCGCGNEGGNQNSDGSMLRHYAMKTAENIAKAIRPLFN